MVLGAIGAGALGGATVTIVIRAIDQYSDVFKNVNKGMLAAGAAITAMGVAGAMAMGGLIKQAGAFEQTTIAFTTMLGSAEEAQVLLKELADFAAKTPFTIPGIEASSKQLLAMGVEVDDLLPTLKSLGDISAGLNVPLDRLALNFGQVKVQGKLTGRELRDFAVAGVPLIAELAKNLNVSEAEIKDMVSAGKIGFAEVENAFTTMTSEGGKFYDLMDAQSKTFLGQVSNIQDSFIKLGRVMGEVFLPMAKAVAEKIAILVGWFEEHPKIAKWVAVFLGIGTALALIIGPILLFLAILPAIAAGIGMVTTVSLPWLLIILAVIAAIVAIIAIIVNWKKILISLVKLMVRAAIEMAMVWEKFKDFWVVIWESIKNSFIKVWNFILGFYENAINKVIGGLNAVTKAMNKLPGINIPIIPKIDLGQFEGALTDIDALKEKQEAERGALRAGLEMAGDFIVDSLADKIGFEKEPTTVINIDSVVGLDSEDVSKSLSDELGTKMSLFTQ